MATPYFNWGWDVGVRSFWSYSFPLTPYNHTAPRKIPLFRRWQWMLTWRWNIHIWIIKVKKQITFNLCALIICIFFILAYWLFLVPFYSHHTNISILFQGDWFRVRNLFTPDLLKLLTLLFYFNVVCYFYLKFPTISC